ncbi:MAG: hypothetical protein LAO76_16265 [Acidobacteriia bacterium]|nr:hypothetical protein [Terriglobia bacterium]
MPLGSLIHDLWIASIALQLLLAGGLLVKRAWQKYPVFVAYIFFNLLRTGATFSIYGTGIVYFYTFWICEGICIILGLAVVREIFTNIFAPHAALRKLAILIFRVAVVALVLLACGAIYEQSLSARSIARVLMVATDGTRIIELGLIMFLFLSSSAFGLHWRQNEFGIALGLGTCVAVELINVTLMTHHSGAAAQIFSVVRSFSFNFSLLIWLGYLMFPERATGSGELPKKAQLEQWNQAVTELINR